MPSLRRGFGNILDGERVKPGEAGEEKPGAGPGGKKDGKDDVIEAEFEDADNPPKS